MDRSEPVWSVASPPGRPTPSAHSSPAPGWTKTALGDNVASFTVEENAPKVIGSDREARHD